MNHDPKAKYQECCEAWDRLNIPDVQRPDYVEWLENEYTSAHLSIDGWRERWRRKATLVNQYRRFIVERLEPVRRLAMEISEKYEPCGYYCDGGHEHVIDHKLYIWAKYLYGSGTEYYVPEGALIDRAIRRKRKVDHIKSAGASAAERHDRVSTLNKSEPCKPSYC